MTENDDIKKILYMGVDRSGVENEHSKIEEALQEVMKYRAIGTLDQCREAVERMKPKKPNNIYSDFYPIVHYYCPKCGRRFGERGIHNVILFDKEKFCQGDGCGQAIEWEE